MEHSRSPDLSDRRLKEFQLRKSKKIDKKLNTDCKFVCEDITPEFSKESTNRQKIAKDLTDEFSFASEDVTPEFAKQSIDFSTISEISDANHSSDISEVPLISASTSDAMLFDSVEVDVVVNRLSQARSRILNSSDVGNQTRKLLGALIKAVIDDFQALPQERDRTAEIISRKACVVSLCFLFWILVVVSIFFFSSEGRCSSSGVLPT